MFNRLIAATAICLLSAASTAQAGNQLFEASWRVKAQGNEITAGTGPGCFSLPCKEDANTLAKVVVNQGAAKFGGAMRMLGQFTSKACYYRNGGCSIVSANWRYDAIGAAAHTNGGVVTGGHQAPWCDGPGPTSGC